MVKASERKRKTKDINIENANKQQQQKTNYLKNNLEIKKKDKFKIS